MNSTDEWNGGTEHERTFLNELNQLFVTTVRAQGGNNQWRILMTPTYAASASTTATRAFARPDDVVEGRLAWSIHAYTPFGWAHDGWGRYAGASSLAEDFDRLQNRSNALGMPIVLGEWGSVNNINHAENTSPAVRAQHAHDYMLLATTRGMAALWWDNANRDGNNVTSPASTHGFGLVSRTERVPYHPEIVERMREGAQAGRAARAAAN
jgi:endoglucanase